MKWWDGRDLNTRHSGLQPLALPVFASCKVGLDSFELPPHCHSGADLFKSLEPRPHEIVKLLCRLLLRELAVI